MGSSSPTITATAKTPRMTASCSFADGRRTADMSTNNAPAPATNTVPRKMLSRFIGRSAIPRKERSPGARSPRGRNRVLAPLTRGREHCGECRESTNGDDGDELGLERRPFRHTNPPFLWQCDRTIRVIPDRPPHQVPLVVPTIIDNKYEAQLG